MRAPCRPIVILENSKGIAGNAQPNAGGYWPTSLPGAAYRNNNTRLVQALESSILVSCRRQIVRLSSKPGAPPQERRLCTSRANCRSSVTLRSEIAQKLIWPRVQ